MGKAEKQVDQSGRAYLSTRPSLSASVTNSLCAASLPAGAAHQSSTHVVENDSDGSVVPRERPDRVRHEARCRTHGKHNRTKAHRTGCENSIGHDLDERVPSGA